MTMAMIAMVIVSVMTAVIMPMITIPVFMIITDYFLVPASFVIFIFNSHIGIMPPRAGLIYNHFVSVIKIIIAILGR